MVKSSDLFKIAGLAAVFATLGLLGYREVLKKKVGRKEQKNVTTGEPVELGKTEIVYGISNKDAKLIKLVILTITRNDKGTYYNMVSLEELMKEVKYQLKLNLHVAVEVLEKFPKDVEEMKDLMNTLHVTNRVYQFLTDNKLRFWYLEKKLDGLRTRIIRKYIPRRFRDAIEENKKRTPLVRLTPVRAF
jgi:hypothetical protein